ncbi:MAG TPA: phospholipid carrier-dependent glycosyltransferase [Gaiellaceae bacterium]|nr:phospholipid carrier-dependent glycosyltransferase [Gaiellaceae bacterium]
MPSSSAETRPTSSPTPAPAERRRVEALWGGPKVALAAIVAGAAVLRVVGVAYAHPFALFSPDEQSIVPRAWHMAHGGGLDPHWFDYPTLLMYVLAPFQAWESHPSYLSARIVVIVLALGAVVASWWLGRRAYGDLAGIVAAAAVAVETTHVTYSRMAVTDVPLTLGVAVSLALLVAGRIELAGLAAGIATSFKYPGVFLLVPLVLVSWRQWRRTLLAIALSAVAFAATSPYFLVHFGSAFARARQVQDIARHGWLGFEHDHIAPIAFTVRLWDGFGPVLLICVAGLVLALVRRTRADVILASFVLVYFADLCTLGAHFDRYTLPLVPPLAALAGRIRALVPVTLLLLVVPLTWTIRDDARLTKTDTRVVARSWVEHHVRGYARLAVDPSLPPFSNAYRIVKLDLPLPTEDRPDPDRDVHRLRLEDVRYIVVTGAVVDRVLAAREDYPFEARFYESLKRLKRVFYVGKDQGDLNGPWVAVYRLRTD